MLRIEGGWSIEPEFIFGGNDRCLQNCVHMALASNGLTFTPKEINQMTAYEPGKNSQFSIATISLEDYLPGTILYTQLDFDQYATRGEEYLKETFGRDWYEHQRRLSSPGFCKEQRAAQKLAETGLWQHYDLSPEATDAKKMLCESLLSSEHLLIVSIDAGFLYDFNEPSAHAVLAFGELIFPDELRERFGEGQGFWIHDPGMQTGEGYLLHIPKNRFAEAIRTHVIAIPKPEDL